MHSEKVPYYILDLLQQVPSVWVQGLGRFDAIFHPAVIDFQESRIKPPFLVPGFEAGQETPDDLLAAYMHYTTGLDKEDALQSIRDFAGTVKRHIDAAETYTIEKFGTFTKPIGGTLHFTPDWDAFNLSFSGLEAIDLYPKSEAEPIAPVNPPEYIPEIRPPAIIIPELENTWVTDRESASPATPAQPVPIHNSPVISDNTSRLWWTILASALLLITILCGYLAWDILSNRGRILQYTAITNDSLSESIPDLIFVDTLDVTQEVIEEDTLATIDTLREPEVVENNDPPCFIVVGAFGNPDNVKKMEERLIELDYTAEIIEGGSLTKVAIRTSCDPIILQRTLNDARSAINPEAWIY